MGKYVRSTGKAVYVNRNGSASSSVRPGLPRGVRPRGRETPGKEKRKREPPAGGPLPNIYLVEKPWMARIQPNESNQMISYFIIDVQHFSGHF